MNIIYYFFLISLNILFFDIYNFKTIKDFNPISWHIDYLRHHATSNNILQFFHIKGIYDSNLSDGSYLYAWPIPNFIYAIKIFIFGDTFAFLISVFLFSIISYYCLVVFLNLFCDKELSKFSAFLCLTISNGIIYYFISGAKVLDQVIILHRVVNPLFSYPILFLFMWSFLKTFKTLKPIYGIISGLIFGSLFLSYIYFAVFAFIFALIICLKELYFSKKFLKFNSLLNQLKRPFIYFIIGSLPGLIPFISNYSQMNKLGQIFIDWKGRNGVISTHALIIENSDWIHFLLIIPALFIFCAAYKTAENYKNKEMITLGFIPYLSAWLASNSNIITGISPQKTNFTAYLNFPFFLLTTIIGSFIFYKYLKFKEKYLLFCFISISIISTIFNLNFIKEYSNNIQNNKLPYIKSYNLSFPKEERDLIKWINDNKLNGVKILAQSDLSRKIAAFTESDTYFIDYLSKATNSTLQKRLDIINSVFKDSENVDYLLSNKKIIDELKKNKVSYIIFKHKLETSLPCINMKSFGNLKVCKLNLN